MRPASLLRLSRAHRWLGIATTVPLVGWVVSSFVLHGVALALPNGLQGVYELGASDSDVMGSATPDIVAPDSILSVVATEGLARVYWVRLESQGGDLMYIVKPGPFELERVYDARTATRLDPLDDERLLRIADAELRATRAASIQPGDEFNRYYALERVPAREVRMEGTQPSTLVLSTTGRVLRRTDPLAAWFHKAYLSVHVWQWGHQLRLFTAILYAFAGAALVLVMLGYGLWWTRREARKRWTSAVRLRRRLHARVAPVAGLVLATQMIVGAYLWFNLGLIEPRFRGQGSFKADWEGGIRVDEELAPAPDIAGLLRTGGARLEGPLTRVEWRAVGEDRFWVAYDARDADGVLIDARQRAVLDRLTPDVAAAAASSVVRGNPVSSAVESSEYWMDFNARVPTWRIRFDDPDRSDVHVSQTTGDVVQRRPAMWRSFGPFLAYHTFSFTGNPWLDTGLLTILQVLVLIMIVTGWGLVLNRTGRGGLSPRY